jgi:DNA invertase Pin-like site-specific DNA recombinase
LQNKRGALYMRVSTFDQSPQTQLHELRQFASQRGLQIVQEYTDHGISGIKARRPALDKMLDDARRHRFDVLLVWSCDRLARSTKHLLQTLDELNAFGIQFLSQREAIDTEGPLGRAIIVIVSAIAELERSLIVERVKAGMLRAKLEGRQIGRARLEVDREQVYLDRRSGMSLTQVAKKHAISRASVCRIMRTQQASAALLQCNQGGEKMDYIDNSGKKIGSLTSSVSNDEVVTINRLRDVTTITVRDRNTGKVRTETFIGDSPFGK